MGHHITALVFRAPCDPQALERYDLHPIQLPQGLTLCHIDHYYSACWQEMTKTVGTLPTSGDVGMLFPDEAVLARIAGDVLLTPKPHFAIIQTDYFAGAGEQSACVYRGRELADPEVRTIDEALRHLGVAATDGQDAFDTVGLGDIRSDPDHLDRYRDLADELGV